MFWFRRFITTRDDVATAVGHPTQSRGLSPSDRAPVITLLVTGLACLALGKAFLVLQRNYETESASFAAAQLLVSRVDTEPLVALPAVTVARAEQAARALHLAALSAGPRLLLAQPQPAAVPAACNAQEHLDLDGYALTWGLSFKTQSAAECCQVCQEHVPSTGQPGRCTHWVWCPEAVCWSPDIHNHTQGECWAKLRVDREGRWLEHEAPVVNHQGRFSDDFRLIHRTAPLFVPWTAGFIKRE